jgi:hypothetical protein
MPYVVVSSPVVRLVTRAMTAGVDQDELIVRLQGINVSEEMPQARVQRVAMLKNQGWSSALNLVMDAVMDADASVIRWAGRLALA